MATRFLKAQNGGIYKDSTGKPIAVDMSLPALSNPATAEDIASGKEAINADGVVITGTAVRVENKLPLVVGTQSADNLYDITASDLKGVTELVGYAFYQKQGLKSIELPETCTSIGTSGLANCTSLTSVSMPNVTSIGTSGFASCSKLQSVNMPNVRSIDDQAFNSCTSLTSVSMPNVTSIGTSGLANCTALTSLTIPSTCTSIGANSLRCGKSTNKCTFTFEGTTPPSIQSNTFYKSYLNKIIVPVGCGEAYKTATNWSNFASYIEEATA